MGPHLGDIVAIYLFRMKYFIDSSITVVSCVVEINVSMAHSGAHARVRVYDAGDV